MSEEDQQQRVGTETGSPRKTFLQTEPLQWIRKTFQGLCSHWCGFACMQNSPAEQRSGHTVRWESGAWVDPVWEKTHNCTAEIRNKAMEEQLLWKISSLIGTVIVLVL